MHLLPLGKDVKFFEDGKHGKICVQGEPDVILRGPDGTMSPDSAEPASCMAVTNYLLPVCTPGAAGSSGAASSSSV